MNERFLRTEMILGAPALDKLRRSHVAVFGLGGVGSYLGGLLDQKVGVKKATVWMCLMHGIRIQHQPPAVRPDLHRGTVQGGGRGGARAGHRP